jgi:hypothetical protein
MRLLRGISVKAPIHTVIAAAGFISFAVALGVAAVWIASYWGILRWCYNEPSFTQPGQNGFYLCVAIGHGDSVIEVPHNVIELPLQVPFEVFMIAPTIIAIWWFRHRSRVRRGFPILNHDKIRNTSDLHFKE